MTSIAKQSHETRMRMVADQLHQRALITLDPDGMIVDWTYGAQQAFGWAPEEAVGKAASILLPPEDRSTEGVTKQLTRARDTGHVSELRWQVKKDGTRFFCEDEVSPLWDVDGTLAGYAKVVCKAKTALQLHESEAKFRAMVNATPHMVWSALANGFGDYFNERFVAFTGRPLDSLRGNGWTELVHPVDRSTVWEAWCRSVQEEAPLSAEFRIRHCSGQYRWVLCRAEPVLGEFRHVARWMGTNTDIHDQKAAQEMLAENEELFRSLVTATSQVVWRVNAQGEAIFDSSTWTAFTGQTYDEGKGTGWLAAIHPLDRERAVATWSEATRDGSRFEGEYRVWHVSGEYRWMVVRGVPILNKDGSVREWVGTNTDITEKKQTELVLQEARLRTDAILNAGDIGTWMLDLVADRIYGDANLDRLFGVHIEDADGVSPEVYFAALHPDDIAHARQRVAHAIATGEPYQEIYRVGVPGGGWRFLHVRGKVQYANDGTPLWLPGVALDVTALKAVEEELRRREERYRALFNSIDEGFSIVELIYDEEGRPNDYRFLEANPAAGKHNGLHDVVGKTLRELVPSPQAGWVELYDMVVRTGEPARFVDRSPGLGKWFDVSVTRLGAASNHHVALLFSDISERKKSEEELQRLATDLSRVNQRQGEFLATLAHELRNPLAPLRTGLDLMRAGLEVPPAVARIHDMMDRQVSHLTHLVNDLLDLARINSGKIELKTVRQPLKDIVQAAVEVSTPVIRAKQHDLVTEFPDESIWIDADANRLNQVISNLLTNAAKYTPEGGKISLSVDRFGQQAVIRVTDNGIGLAEEDRPGIFEMFSQVGRGMEKAQGGLGIGLNLVKRLTEKHGGTVSVFSPGVNQGSTFTVQLPVVQRAVDRAEGNGGIEHEPARRTLRVVLADDNVDAAFLIKELLEVHGHSVRMVGNGMDALHAIKEMRPDLALLDIGMPAMNGYQVATAVRQDSTLRHVTLAAVTGWSTQEDRDKAREAGFDHHLTKPVSFDSLLDLIAKIKLDE